jgi:hypothetical protein
MRPSGIVARTTALPSSRGRHGRLSLSAAALITMSLMVLAVLLYYAQFSGSLQWVLGLSFLAVLAALAWRQVFRGTAEPAPLVVPPSPEAYEPGELDAVASSVRRASRGLRYSQVIVTSRARAAFLDRVRLSLGMAPEAMRDVQRDPEALRRLFRDDVLADFLHIRIGDLEERYAWVLRARERGGFTRQFREVLARMEAWR